MCHLPKSDMAVLFNQVLENVLSVALFCLGHLKRHLLSSNMFLSCAKKLLNVLAYISCTLLTPNKQRLINYSWQLKMRIKKCCKWWRKEQVGFPSVISIISISIFRCDSVWFWLLNYLGRNLMIKKCNFLQHINKLFWK